MGKGEQPTVLRVAGCRFYFYSHEPNEPPHLSNGWCERLGRSSWRHGMAFSARATTADVRVHSVSVIDDELSAALMDGRRISVPLGWYPRLANATAGRARALGDCWRRLRHSLARHRRGSEHRGPAARRSRPPGLCEVGGGDRRAGSVRGRRAPRSASGRGLAPGTLTRHAPRGDLSRRAGEVVFGPLTLWSMRQRCGR